MRGWRSANAVNDPELVAAKALAEECRASGLETAIRRSKLSYKPEVWVRARGAHHGAHRAWWPIHDGAFWNSVKGTWPYC